MTVLHTCTPRGAWSLVIWLFVLAGSIYRALGLLIKLTALYGSDTTVGIHWYLMYRGWEYIYTTVCLATCCFMSSSALVINSLAEETRASFTASRMLLVDSKEYNLSSTCPRGKCKRLNKTLRTYREEVGWTLIPFSDMIHIQTIHNSTQPQ